MKTQIIKIIPCLLAGFILSACVGAVTVPPDVADKVIKPANPCIANPFGDTCATEEFNDARKAVCMGSNAERCAPIIKRECEADSLDALCDGLAKYFTARKTACGSEPNSERCTATTERVCRADLLDAYCTNSTKYHPMQKTACESEPNSERCKATYARICADDIFNPYCADAQAHYSARETACRSEPNSERCKATYARICTNSVLSSYCVNSEAHHPAQKTACKRYPLSDQCRPTITRVCGADVLDTLCRLTRYYNARVAACISNNTDPRCASHIAGECSSNPFHTICLGLPEYFTARFTECELYEYNKRSYIRTQDKRYYTQFSRTDGQCAPTTERVCGGDDALNSYCDGLTQYEPARKAACNSDNPDPRCPPIMAQLCIDTPFDTACQKNNLTYYDLYDLSVSLSFNTWRRLPTQYICNHNQFTRSPNCYFNLSTTINITPLNDTNTGTATYTGGLRIVYDNNDYSEAERADPNYEYEYENQTTNINLVVNFGDNSLSYSGMIATNAFSINGNFTDRGQITGTANFRDTEATLFGLIGQTEMIGAFATGYKDKAFTGGFTATRE
ncbi:MAG: transferrin-binding protein-like solute binding protein [Proteobacteria bacterium]|nr:transferrin-binding protein-like solute binding protein [Pseudomonadota bacterium]